MGGRSLVNMVENLCFFRFLRIYLFGVGLENPCWCLDIYPILLSILIFLQPAYYADSCGYVDIPAVESQSGRGSTVRVTICVSPGSGYIRIYGVDRVESDTIVSIFAAYILAQIYSGKRLSASDLLYILVETLRIYQAPQQVRS
jgi:hypothetical protein